MHPAGYDSVPSAGIADWLPGLWDSPEDVTEGDEIRLAQSPQWGLTLKPSFFATSWPQVVVQQSGLYKWIKRLDGTIALAARPNMILAVEGDLGSGVSRIVVAREGTMPPQSCMWKLAHDGRITLEHSPELGLSVPYGKFENGAAVVLSNVAVASENNKFRLNAGGAGSLQASTPSKLRVVGSRGDPNTLWTALTGAISYQQGHIAISQAYRDSDSSWAYVTENPHHPQIATFVKEPWGGKGFLLKLVEDKGKKSETRYMSCVENLAEDKRDDKSTWVYVTKNRTYSSVFEEETTKEGLVLKSGNGYLCCAKFNDRPTEYGSDYTWLYTVQGSSNLAACLVVEPSTDSTKQESWWKAFLRKNEKYIRWFLILLGVIVIVSIIIAIVNHARRGEEPRQIIIPYDCNHQPEHMWSHTKVAWCCKHHQLACPTDAPSQAPVLNGVPGTVMVPKTADDDCFTDVLNWQRDWTISKQNFCCENHGIACQAAMTTPAFDCNEDYHKWTERWSYQKKLWCCLHHERGCPASKEASASFDCAAGYSDSDSWAQEKKEWCCYHASVGCPASETAAKYDCDAGYNNWLHGWSEGKKVWCCFHSGRACSESSNADEYDCDAGLENWQVGWSNNKIDFCCQTQRKGCAHVV